MAKGKKARAQKVAAGGRDKGDGAPAHASKKRKAAPEDPATKDADQAVQPARKKKKKKQKAKKKEQPQPQKQQQKAKQKPSKANAQQLQVPAGSGGVLNAGAASSSSQTLSVDSSVLGPGALQPNKVAAAAAGRHKRTFAVQGRRGGKDTASGAVIVTQRRTLTGVDRTAASCIRERQISCASSRSIVTWLVC
jgi:outer membrane biosynthesis protein TonB